MFNKSVLVITLILVASPSLAIIPNCATYSSDMGPERCLACYSGYYITTGGYCGACAIGCSSCSGTSNFCTACKASYYLTVLNTCFTCLTNCISCSNGVTCGTCNFGYQKKNGYYNGSDICEGTTASAGSAAVVIVIVLVIFLLIPCIICCICWSAIAQCFGWSQGSTTTYIDSNPTYNSDFHHPPQPAYNNGFNHPPPAYNNGFNHPPPPAYGGENIGYQTDGY